MRCKYKKCIDAGSKHCPCRLAESGNCMVCSRLAGHDRCDCDWQGVCIYNEYKQNGNRLGLPRQEVLCRIREKKWYDKSLVVMCIEVPAGMAEAASFPGSYVFVRKPGDEPFFYTPLSIMKTDYEQRCVQVAIQVNGPKTKAIAGADQWVELRGIYTNGLRGRDKLISHNPLKVLCLAKGAGVAPLINYCRWSGGKDHVDFIVDTEKITEDFVRDYLEESGANSVKYQPLPLDITWTDVEKYNAIVISASDYYQQNIYIPESKKVVSNNCHMCCGEGICGACIYTDKNGKAHRMCKCNAVEIL